MKRRRNSPSRAARQSGTRVMFLIRLHMMPSPEMRCYQSVGGAYINCWIVASTMEQATERALHDMQRDGWIPDSVEYATEIKRTDCVSDCARELYDQAMIDQEVFDIHTYPREDADTQES